MIRMTEEILGNIREERIKKLEELRSSGLDPFAYTRFERTRMTKEIIEKHSGIKPNEKLENEKVAVAGRIRAVRRHGGGSFFDLEDFDGKIQVWISLDTVGKKIYDAFEKVDVGDIAGVKGYIFKTARGELSIWVEEFFFLAKSIRQLPSKWFGLKDVEKRYRERYVDLIMNPKVKDVFIKKTKIIQAMREFLDSKGFLEVDTPVLQPIYGGALAKPFVTHHNALKRDLYLRIADELYLKRLIVGGFEKVYEISKDFRNEGIDTRHNPEFTQMEFYQAYIDYHGVMDLAEEMVVFIAEKVLGTTKIKYKEYGVDLKSPWARISMLDSIKKYVGIDVERESIENLKKLLKEKNLEVKDDATKGEIMIILFEELVQPQLIQPTFVLDHPTEISPLAKKKPGNPRLTERFELFIGTEECGNAFSELNDPIDQRERFEEQARRRAAGDEEAHSMDDDYIKALEYGMPPTGGFGIGIERFTMILTNSPSIRDVILFPQLREQKEKEIFGDVESDQILKKEE